MPSRTLRKSHRKSHRRSTKTHRRHRGGEINPYAFNYALFESMHSLCLEYAVADMEFADKKMFFGAIEKELKDLLEDEEIMDVVNNRMNNYINDPNEHTMNSKRIYTRLLNYLQDNLNESIDNIINIFSLGVLYKLGKVTEVDFEIVENSDLKRNVISIVSQFVSKLPEANRKSQQNASNTYKVMSRALPPNVAATVAAYHTGVEHENNPAYMEGY